MLLVERPIYYPALYAQLDRRGMKEVNPHPGTGERVSQFKAALDEQPKDHLLVQQYILHGSCFAIDESTHFVLKQAVATESSLQVATDVFVVGSAKLGFSVAPTKRWRGFGDHSDLDIAIVNHDLYEMVWHEVNAYRRSGADWPKQEKFESYLAWGWIRPDMLPRSPVFSFSNRWWEFFRGLRSQRLAGPHKVAAALYHDINFLVDYQVQAINACRPEGI